MAATVEHCVETIRDIQKTARKSGNATRPRWPMIVLRSPKGWGAPAEFDGHKLEGSWRAHQIPITDVKTKPKNLKVLETWMRSLEPEKLFDKQGKLKAEYKELAPLGASRMSANPHTNGGMLKRDLRMPDFREYAAKFDKPCQIQMENTYPLGVFLRDIMKRNMHNFRVFGQEILDRTIFP
jgi:xylulose-5-phosphate/fructose-6-phosphate phosphoketolase